MFFPSRHLATIQVIAQNNASSLGVALCVETEGVGWIKGGGLNGWVGLGVGKERVGWIRGSGQTY